MVEGVVGACRPGEGFAVEGGGGFFAGGTIGTAAGGGAAVIVSVSFCWALSIRWFAGLIGLVGLAGRTAGSGCVDVVDESLGECVAVSLGGGAG